jgi:phage recombination protein Bet
MTKSVLITMADRYGMEPSNFERTLRATVVPPTCTPEQFAAFLLVAAQYDLNPITREIYAFPRPGGGIQPIVGVDGWASLINRHPAHDGMEFTDWKENGKVAAIECKIYRKDRAHPTTVIEYMEECHRDTQTWKQWPCRMLRHKAMIQGARYAFGFAGIQDPDEFERWQAEPKSKSAYQSRKDGYYPLLQNELREAKSIQQVKDIWVSYQDKIRDFPTQWQELASEEYDRAKLRLIEDKPMEEPTTPLVEQLKASVELEKRPLAPMDPDKYLDGLESDLLSCKSTEDIGDVWANYEPTRPHLLEPDRQKADAMFDKYLERLGGHANPDAKGRQRTRARL